VNSVIENHLAILSLKQWWIDWTVVSPVISGPTIWLTKSPRV